jgi:hypothetical protein
VDFSSAQRLARYNVYMVEDADHMDVCKPPSKAHPSYRLLLQLINICQEVSVYNFVSFLFYPNSQLLSTTIECDISN